ncbi:S9 family peptidase [Virgibacillus halophilus]|uniref:S9 family peptidase n=1 Tax=Tigheibacillus halophilus TaxID=361280 RepID=A0ABU5C9J3_9BACI|nr:S9 family peptidase [Virgibacillus halophilus]
MYDLVEKTFTKLTDSDNDHHLLDISPDGKSVLFCANLHEESDYEQITDLYMVNTDSKEIRQLTNGDGSYYQGSFSPNGEKIACLGHEFPFAGATQNELFIFDLSTNERICLSKDWDMQLGDSMIGDFQMGTSEKGPVWSKEADKLFFIASKEGATALYSVTTDHTRSTLFKDHNHVAGFAFNENDDSFILHISKPTEPVNFYLLSADGRVTQLTDANASFLAETELIEPEEVTFTAEDGWEIQGWLLKPYGFTSGEKYPFILEIHGGPHAMYGRTFFHEMQLLAAKGYVVLYVNPRGSYGYGQKFVDACRKDYGGKDYRDLMAAVDHALKSFDFIDAERLGVTGGSYGGFMTNWIVSHTNRFKAAVTQRSISNWLSFYGVSDIGYFFTEWEHGLNLLDDPKKAVGYLTT